MSRVELLLTVYVFIRFLLFHDQFYPVETTDHLRPERRLPLSPGMGTISSIGATLVSIAAPSIPPFQGRLSLDSRVTCPSPGDSAFVRSEAAIVPKETLDARDDGLFVVDDLKPVNPGNLTRQRKVTCSAGRSPNPRRTRACPSGTPLRGPRCYAQRVHSQSP